MAKQKSMTGTRSKKGGNSHEREPKRSPAAASGPRVSGHRAVWRRVLSVLLLLGIIATAVMIFLFSAESKEESGDRSGGVTEWIASVIFVDYEDLTPAERTALLQMMGHPVRKLAHLSEYAFLAVLCGAFCLVTWERMKTFFRWLLPGGFCLLYAISDEVHQIFSNRGAAFRDVMIDFAGSLLGLCLLYGLVALIRGCIRRRRARRSAGGRGQRAGKSKAEKPTKESKTKESKKKLTEKAKKKPTKTE